MKIFHTIASWMFNICPCMAPIKVKWLWNCGWVEKKLTMATVISGDVTGKVQERNYMGCLQSKYLSKAVLQQTSKLDTVLWLSFQCLFKCNLLQQMQDNEIFTWSIQVFLHNTRSCDLIKLSKGTHGTMRICLSIDSL